MVGSVLIALNLSLGVLLLVVVLVLSLFVCGLVD